MMRTVALPAASGPSSALLRNKGAAQMLTRFGIPSDERLCQRLPTQEQGTWPQESKGRNSTVVPLTAFLKLRGGPSAQEVNIRGGEINT